VLNFDALPQTIDIDKDLTSLSTPRLVHIGSETFRASAFTSSTVTLNERAVGGSEYQYHAISLQGSSVPILSTEITIFRGRRCKLFIAYQDSAGNVSDYECIINGFIESSPSVEDGDAVALSILPLVSLIDGELADNKKGISYLLQNFHYFHTKSNIMEYGSAWGNDYFLELSNPTAISGTETTIEVDAPQFYLDDIFDLNRPKGQGFISPHPRYPLLLIGAIEFATFPTAFSTVGTPTITIDHSITGSVSQATILTYFTGNTRAYGKIPKRGEIKRVTIASNELKAWPECLNDALSNQVSTTSHKGIDGKSCAIF